MTLNNQQINVLLIKQLIIPPPLPLTSHVIILFCSFHSIFINHSLYLFLFMYILSFYIFPLLTSFFPSTHCSPYIQILLPLRINLPLHFLLSFILLFSSLYPSPFSSSPLFHIFYYSFLCFLFIKSPSCSIPFTSIPFRLPFLSSFIPSFLHLSSRREGHVTLSFQTSNHTAFI